MTEQTPAKRGPGRPIKYHTFAELQAAEKRYAEKTRARRSQLRENAGLAPMEKSKPIDLTNVAIIRTGQRGRPARDLTAEERAQYKREQKKEYRARTRERRIKLKDDTPKVLPSNGVGNNTLLDIPGSI
jgi:hypothetical protein